MNQTPSWESLWAEAQTISILDVAERLGFRLVKSGPDFIGPCVAGCARKDGFVLTPNKHLFLCRPSGESGDSIDLVIHANGCSKSDALAFVLSREINLHRTESDEERHSREARWRAQQETALRRGEEAARHEVARQRRSSDHVAAVLGRALPIAGTHAETYLMRGRKLDGVPKRFLSDLRFVPDLPYWGYVDERASEPVKLADGLPAMVVPYRDAAGAVVGIHETFLDPDEPRKWAPSGDQKRNKDKKMRAKAGGALIRLGRVSEILAVAEGIETALSWSLVMMRLGRLPEGVSLAAAGSIGNLCGKATGSIPHPSRRNERERPVRIANGEPDMSDSECMVLPEGVRELILLADSDGDHLAAWAKIGTAVHRFEARGVVVRVHAPPVGMDWGDVLEAMS